MAGRGTFDNFGELQSNLNWMLGNGLNDGCIVVYVPFQFPISRFRSFLECLTIVETFPFKFNFSSIFTTYGISIFLVASAGLTRRLHALYIGQQIQHEIMARISDNYVREYLLIKQTEALYHSQSVFE